FVHEQELPDGRFLKGIKFRFPIFYNGVETDQLDFESCWDKETNDETVCLLSKLHEAKHHVNVKLDIDEMDLTAAESIHPQVAPAPQELQDKHGANAYYGQN
ncbi:MAG: hypothetical protein MR817_07180, partial [Lachnospiraceae bacterium]|nr:hypothetical protein [Lachnospiraceae bacterium]